MLEKRLKAVPAQAFTSDGTANGKITVSSAALFKVKQQIFLSASSLPNIELEIKNIEDEHILYVGPKGGSINTREDVSQYTVALGASISANEQKRPTVPVEEINRAVYEEEPTVAQRVVLVNEMGDKYGKAKPFQITDSFQNDAQGVEVTITSTPIEAKGGPVRLNTRKGIFIMCMNENNYFGFSSSVTSSSGIPLFRNQLMYLPAAVDMPVYLVRENGTGTARVWEVG
jgi:hypothetical protein